MHIHSNRTMLASFLLSVRVETVVRQVLFCVLIWETLAVKTVLTTVPMPIACPPPSILSAKVLLVDSRPLPALRTPLEVAINVGYRTVSPILPPVPTPGRAVVGGEVHVYDSGCRMKTIVAVYAGTRARSRFQIKAILDSGGKMTVIREDALEQMKQAGAADLLCEVFHPHPIAVQGLGGLVECHKSVLLSVQFHDQGTRKVRLPTAVLSVWALVVPVEGVKAQCLILARDVYMNFMRRTYRRIYSCLPGSVATGKLTLDKGANLDSHHPAFKRPLWFFDYRGGYSSSGGVPDFRLPVPDHGQDFVEGVVCIDDNHFSAKVGLYSPSAEASATFSTIGKLDSGSSRTYIREDVWEWMKEMGAATPTDEWEGPPLKLGGVGTSCFRFSHEKIARLCVQFCDEHLRPTAHVTVDATILHKGLAECALILGYQSFGRFDERSYEVRKNADESEFVGTMTLKRVGLTREQHNLRIMICFLLQSLQQARTGAPYMRTTVDEGSKATAGGNLHERHVSPIVRGKLSKQTQAYKRRLARLSKVRVRSVEHGIQSRYGFFGSKKVTIRAAQTLHKDGGRRNTFVNMAKGEEMVGDA